MYKLFRTNNGGDSRFGNLLIQNVLVPYLLPLQRGSTTSLTETARAFDKARLWLAQVVLFALGPVARQSYLGPALDTFANPWPDRYKNSQLLAGGYVRTLLPAFLLRKLNERDQRPLEGGVTGMHTGLLLEHPILNTARGALLNPNPPSSQLENLAKGFCDSQGNTLYTDCLCPNCRAADNPPEGCTCCTYCFQGPESFDDCPVCSLCCTTPPSSPEWPPASPGYYYPCSPNM